MPRSESVQRADAPAPFRHPGYESPRARDRHLFELEIRQLVAASDALRRQLASARILECRA